MVFLLLISLWQLRYDTAEGGHQGAKHFLLRAPRPAFYYYSWDAETYASPSFFFICALRNHHVSAHTWASIEIFNQEEIQVLIYSWWEGKENKYHSSLLQTISVQGSAGSHVFCVSWCCGGRVSFSFRYRGTPLSSIPMGTVCWEHWTTNATAQDCSIAPYQTIPHKMEQSFKYITHFCLHISYGLKQEMLLLNESGVKATEDAG